MQKKSEKTLVCVDFDGTLIKEITFKGLIDFCIKTLCSRRIPLEGNFKLEGKHIILTNRPWSQYPILKIWCLLNRVSCKVVCTGGFFYKHMNKDEIAKAKAEYIIKKTGKNKKFIYIDRDWDLRSKVYSAIDFF